MENKIPKCEYNIYPIKQQYRNWINNYIQKNNGNVKNHCTFATSEMIKAFPELKREKGYVWVITDFGSKSDEHWWCIDPDGNIVDPTASQYREVCFYEPYNEKDHGPLPTGKCMDCGEYVYDNNTFCNKTCEKLTMFYLQGYHISFINKNNIKYYIKEMKNGKKTYGLDRKNFPANSIKELNELVIKDIIE
jgi:hypothetical protein